jgi:hypothetical protein
MTHYNDNMDDEIICPWCGQDSMVDPGEAVFHHEDELQCGWCDKLFNVSIHFTTTKSQETE